MNGRCVARACVPRPLAEGFDSHQVVWEVRGLKTVFDRTRRERQRDRSISWIDRNQAKGQKAALLGPPQFFAVEWVVLVVHMHPKIAVEGVVGIFQRAPGFGRNG